MEKEQANKESSHSSVSQTSVKKVIKDGVLNFFFFVFYYK
jgi:hypothetical protein